MTAGSGMGRSPAIQALIASIDQPVFVVAATGLATMNAAARAFCIACGGDPDAERVFAHARVRRGAGEDGEPEPLLPERILELARSGDSSVAAILVEGEEPRWIRTGHRILDEPSLTTEPVAIVTVIDITVERREQRALTSVIDGLRVNVYLGWIDVRTTAYHESGAYGALEHFLGGPKPDGVSAEAAWASRIHPDDRQIEAGTMASIVAGGIDDVSYRMIGYDGIERWVRDVTRPVRWTDHIVYVEGIVTDVTAAKHDERRLRELHARTELAARTDDLTGVASRRHFVNELTQASQAPRLGDPPPAVLMVDIDAFRETNDVYGSGFADRVLVAVASALHDRFGADGELVCRWAGDAFAVLVQGPRSAAELSILAEDVRSEIAEKEFSIDGVELRLTVSIGASLGDRSRSADQLAAGAGRALSTAKRWGSDRVIVDGDRQPELGDAERAEIVSMARALAATASLKEGVQERHLEQVATLAAAVAWRLGCDPETVFTTELAGWLHDVGKIGIPEQILAKPDLLTDAERAIMHQHPGLGASIISRVPGLRRAHRAVLLHHERFDGTGYPAGLAGAAIPLEARIVSACDTYSAITSDRSYRDARSAEVAVEELRRGSGTMFDPTVVDALIGALSQGGLIGDPDRAQAEVEYPPADATEGAEWQRKAQV